MGSNDFFLMTEKSAQHIPSYFSGTNGLGIFHPSSGRLLFIFLIFFLVGCRESGNKVHIQSPGEFEVQFYHDGSALELWTDFDVEFVEPPAMLYQISFYQRGELVAQVACDPFDADEKQMHRYVEKDGLVKVSYLGQMQCSVDLPEGKTLVSVRFDAQAGRLKIFRADLILK